MSDDWRLAGMKCFALNSLFHSVALLLMGVANGQENHEKWFSLEVGDSWTFEDSGSMTIRVIEEAEIGGEKAMKVGWFNESDEKPYQSEYWRKSDGKYLVCGREIGRFKLVFDKPYCFLKTDLKVGDSWTESVTVKGRTLKLSFTVAGAIETVKTKLGEFEAFKITVNGGGQNYQRWYSPKIGMIKEIGKISLGGQTSPGNEKILVKHTDKAK